MKNWRKETNWKPSSDAVAELKIKVEAAYYASDEDKANSAHDDLVSAEWQLKQAGRGNG